MDGDEILETDRDGISEVGGDGTGGDGTGGPECRAPLAGVDLFARAQMPSRTRS